jgi:DNA processing protein
MRTKIIRLGYENYPESLSKIFDPPDTLYYKGEFSSNLFKKCLGVVGSRKMTPYGEYVTRKIISEVASLGITVVSGFMYGVDATAHSAALSLGGKTVAVMPCGIDLIIPEYQEKLYYEILDSGGLIISEYEGELSPKKWMFPKRNRIVAGLSTAVLVIEASANSGSLITAEIALRNNRKVFAIPGNITSPNSRGIVRLLNGGATAVSGAKEIINYYNTEFEHKICEFGLSKEEENLLEAVGRAGDSINNISRYLGVSITELLPVLTQLELKGLVSKKGEKYYAG